jgi:hypothetical protein
MALRIMLITLHLLLTFSLARADWITLNPASNPAGGSLGATTNGPEMRAWAPGLFDAKRNTFIIFGGGIAGGCEIGYLNDLWSYSYSTNTWTRLAPVKRGSEGADNVSYPRGRDNHMIAYDSAQDLYWMHGGTCTDIAPGLVEQAIWSFNPNTNVWTRYPAPAGVIPNNAWGRYDSGFAYDPLNKKIVLFGGEINGQRTNDTWEFDTVKKDWLQSNGNGASNAPPQRFQCENCMTYDPATKKILLFGGWGTNGVLNDLWTYDTATHTWTELKASGTLPPGRMLHGVALDTKRHLLLIVGGQTTADGLSDSWVYEFATNTWKQLPGNVAQGSHHSAAYDAANDVVLVYSRGVTYAASLGGVISVPRTTPVPTDTTAPSVPANLFASAVSSSQINLSWSASTDNVAVAGYKIFKNGSEIISVDGTTYQDTGLQRSTSYKYTVAAYDSAGNTSAQSAAVSAMTQSPTISSTPPTSGLSIPITIKETAGVNRANDPISAGIPLPPGYQTSAWSLWDGATEIPLQVARLSGEPPWIFVSFQTSLSALQNKTLTLKAIQSSKSPQTPISISEDATQIDINTGPLKAIISKTNFNLFESIWVDSNNDGSFSSSELIIPPQQDNLRITDSTSGGVFSGKGTPDKILWEYKGPVRSTLRVDGRYRNSSGQEFIAYTTRLTFYAGRSDVTVEHVLRNSYRPNERNVKVKSASLKLGTGGTIISNVCSGMENRATCSGPLTQWAKFSASGISFELIPTQWAGNGGIVIPDLSHAGASIVVNFAQNLSTADEANYRAAAQSKLFFLAPASWYSQYGNLTTSKFGTLEDEKQSYQKWGWTWSASQEPVDSPKPNYWVSWKDVAVHDDSESDDLWQHILMYIRTGQRGYLDRATAWARYYKWEYAYRSDGFDYFSGATTGWERPILSRTKISISLTSADQSYLDADVGLGRVDSQDWGGDHFFGWGLIDYYYLTGDVDALEAAVDLGEVSERLFLWRGAGTEMGFYGERQGARNLLLATRLYEATQSTRWKNLMDHIASLWLTSPDWDPRGFYAYGQPDTDNAIQSGAYNAGARAFSTFQQGILSHAFDRYYALTGNAQIKSKLIAMAEWTKNYAFQGTPDQTRAKVAMDWPAPGSVWQNSTTGGGAYTISLIDVLVRAYRLTKDVSYLNQAKLHWERGTGGSIGGMQVTRFENSQFLTDNLYFNSNRGDLPYNNLLFYDAVHPLSVTPSVPTAPSGLSLR